MEELTNAKNNLERERQGLQKEKEEWEEEKRRIQSIN